MPRVSGLSWTAGGLTLLRGRDPRCVFPIWRERNQLIYMRERLASVDAELLTPRAALDLIFELIELARSESAPGSHE